MFHREPARGIIPRFRFIVLVLLVLAAATIGVIGSRQFQSRFAFLWSRRELGEADGVIPRGVTVFRDDLPAVARLHTDLLGALRRAAKDAARGGVILQVNSGWRSPEYQQRLLGEAASKYGSEKRAARWVAPAATSAHVSGKAVDIGPSSARAWLSRHGSAYGLCRIYRNEPWHYEYRPDAIEHGCPPPYADATHDPRMQR